MMRTRFSGWWIATALALATTNAECAAPDAATPRRFEPTGAYRLEHADGRTWVVTPDGEATFILGVNHTQNFLKRPGRTKPLSDEATRRRSNRIVTDLTRWGFTALGYGAPREAQAALPYFEQMNTSGCSRWRSKAQFKYEDVFDPVYERGVTRLVRAVCNRAKKSTNLIGYFWTANPEWGPALARRRRGTDWVSTLRTLPPGAPGHVAYVHFLEERYGEDSAAFEAAYGLPIGDGLSSVDFSTLDPDRETVAADDLVFLGRIAARYYSIIGRETRAADPDHLIFGERYAMRDLPDVVVEAALPHIDVLSVQPMTIGFESSEFERLHELSGKPMLVSDHSVAYPTAEHSNTLWEDVEDAAAVGREYGTFLDTAFARPFFIGLLRCEYSDHVTGDLLRQGMVDLDGEPRTAITDAMKAAHARALELTVATDDDETGR